MNDLPETALSRGPSADPGELFARYLEEYLGKIRWCAERVSEDRLWFRPSPKGDSGTNPRANSIANLMLHLAGNLSLWIGQGLGSVPAHRDRAAEFAADRSHDRTSLLTTLAGAVERSAAVLRRLGPDDLARPLAIQGYDTTGFAAALHAVEHMSYHTGQIVTLAKQLLPAETEVEFYPRHRKE